VRAAGSVPVLRNAFIKLVPLDFRVATRARRLIWDFPWLTARDAIHIATAMEFGIPVVEHYDDDDFGKVAERIKNENLQGFPTIRNPHWVDRLGWFRPRAGLPLPHPPMLRPQLKGLRVTTNYL
jgi:hypothetical protein